MIKVTHFYTSQLTSTIVRRFHVTETNHSHSRLVTIILNIHARDVRLGFVCRRGLLPLFFVWIHSLRPIFSLSQVELCLAVPVDRLRSSISLPGYHADFYFRRAPQPSTLNRQLSPGDYCEEKETSTNRKRFLRTQSSIGHLPRARSDAPDLTPVRSSYSRQRCTYGCLLRGLQRKKRGSGVPRPGKFFI